MPGLLRGVAKTAVVAGTATAVSNRVSRRQANRWAARSSSSLRAAAAATAAGLCPPPPAPAPAVDPMDDKLEQLKQLGELKTQGVLSDQEFEAQKARILGY